MRAVIPFLQTLEREKKRYATAMILVESLLAQTKYDFYCMGLDGTPKQTALDLVQASDIETEKQTAKKEPPLIITPELDCLRKILRVCDAKRSASDIKTEKQTAEKKEPPLIITPELDCLRKILHAWDAVRSLCDPETKGPTLADMESPPQVGEPGSLLHKVMQDGTQPAETKTRISSRWLEPPLIIAAKLGLHGLVHKILHLCPESAIYLNSENRNVVQVAIQFGHKKVVSVISEIFQGKENPLLHSFLCSMLDDDESRNTILHLAAKNRPTEEGDVLQLHHELEWFEDESMQMVENIVPEELRYSRNKEEKTAHELFRNNHKKTLDDCKKQLVELGKACAGLVAAAVFTSSFSIPQNDSQSDNRAYNIFTHAYVIGFGCATSALVLFLSFVLTPYQQRYFRQAIPRNFLLACLSFALALVGFLVSFACNFVLQIYGKQKMQLVTLLLELLLFPLVCIAILIYSGSKLMPPISCFWK